MSAREEQGAIESLTFEALSALEEHNKSKAWQLAYKALELAKVCETVSPLEVLHRQNHFSEEFVNAGMQSRAAVLDAEIRACLPGLSNSQDKLSLSFALDDRQKRYSSSTDRNPLNTRTHHATAQQTPRSQATRTVGTPNARASSDSSQINANNSVHNLRPEFTGYPSVELQASLKIPSWDPRAYARHQTKDASSTGAEAKPRKDSFALGGNDENSTRRESRHRLPSVDETSSMGHLRTPVASSQFAHNNLNTPEGKADEWFARLENETHPFVRGPNKKISYGKKRPIRVAVLDTGFAARDPKYRCFGGKVMQRDNCLSDGKHGDIDEEGHGTDVLYQLSRVCPDAWLYSYRVAQRDNSQLKADKEAVLKALDKAIDDEIDIINMSFGWTYDDLEVEAALQKAQKHGILLFASVSNFGALADRNILFPASHSDVIAIDAADGLGHPDSNNSSTHEGDIRARFTAPGVMVKGVTKSRVNGTSFASPIAAGIAALILDFAQETPLASDSAMKYLKKKTGMEIILKEIQVRKSGAFMFLTPWKLFRDIRVDEETAKVNGGTGGDGGPQSQRYDVAKRIMYKLCERYHGDRTIGYQFGLQ